MSALLSAYLWVTLATTAVAWSLDCDFEEDGSLVPPSCDPSLYALFGVLWPVNLPLVLFGLLLGWLHERGP